MPPAHYNCILPAETYDGFVGSIRVRWSNSAIQRLHTEAGDAGIPVTTMKALCEHLAYISAERLQNDQALIRYENLAQGLLCVSIYIYLYFYLYLYYSSTYIRHVLT